MNKLKKETGITLIALIITIVVLLILAGVAIGTLDKSNIIGRAKETTGLYDTKKAEEEQEIARAEALLNKYQSIYSNDNENGDENGDDNEIPKLSITESYVGYYADVNNDGIADGIIYADLAIGGSGEWVNTSGTKTAYTINKQDNLKEYYIEGDLVKLIDNSVGNDRFYIMALTGVTRPDGVVVNSLVCGNYNSEEWEAMPVITDFGTGKSNTEKILNITANSTDVELLWIYIESELEDGWFVPSVAEMDACNKVTNSSSYYYWTSSKESSGRLYYNTSNGFKGDTASKSGYVRLSRTF